MKLELLATLKPLQNGEKLFDIYVQKYLKLKLSECTFVKTKLNFLDWEV